MKIYYVYIKDEDWGVIVIANNAKEARIKGYNYIKYEYGDEGKFINIRAKIRKGLSIPVNEVNTTFCGCGVDNWLCEAWNYCYNNKCEKYKEKILKQRNYQGE